MITIQIELKRFRLV